VPELAKYAPLWSAADGFQALTCPSLRVRINTAQGQAIEGTLFTVCPITNVVAINAAPPKSNPVAPQPGDYHVIPKSQVQFVQVLSLAGDAATEGGAVTGTRFDEHTMALSRVDMDALRGREEAAIRKMKEWDRTRGKGVTKEAQDIFDWFART
jgi:protein LSM12